MELPHPGGLSSSAAWGPASSAGAASIASVSAAAAPSAAGGAGGGSFRRQSLRQQQQQNEEASKTFGEIEFSGMKQLAKFVRLDSNTPDSALHTILGNKWDLTRPTLVINIFGGDFEKKRQLKMIFKKGLWKAAESAGCWIVTSGFNLGIMKLTGEAVRDYTDAYGSNYMIAIGVSSWNCIARREALEDPNISEGSVPASYQSEESDSSKPKELRASDEDESPLDPNHTHYFLVDTGATDQKKGHECPFRTRFSHVISSWTDEENKQLKVPMCGLLIGGDRFALEQVFYALTETKCPIVAVKGTAGAADVLSSAFDYLFEEENQVDKKEEDEETQEANFNSKMSSICQEFFNCNDYFEYTKEIDMLRVMLKEGASLIEIFDMEEDFDLDGKMISSLLSSAGSEGGEDQLNLKQLKICLTLNRADIARDKIFLENKKWKKGDLNEYMYQALMEDRHDFVKLFLEQGFSLEDFLSIYVLEKLYTDQLKRLNSKVAIFHQLWEYHRSHRNSKKVKLREVGKVIKVLVGDFYQPLYAKKDFEKTYTKSLVTAQSPVDQSTTKALVQTAQTGYLPAYFFTKSGTGNASGSAGGGAAAGDNMPQAVPKRRRLQAGDGSQETQLEICEYERSPINFSGRDEDTSDSNARGYENPIMESSSDSPANASGGRLAMPRAGQRWRGAAKRRGKSKPRFTELASMLSEARPLIGPSQAQAEETRAKSLTLERPARELLIWSLLVGKLQMAELFWTMEKEPIAAALLSSMILKAMGGRTDDFTDKEDFQRGAAQFEDHALGVLDQCYREDERRAQFLINRELAFYGDSSCIYLAAEGESIKFMAHPCCQDFLTSTWMGRLSPKNAMARFSFGILCGMCCPVLIPKVMLFKLTEEEAQRQQAITQQQQQQEDQQQLQQQHQMQLQLQQQQQQLTKTPSQEGVVVDMNEEGDGAQYYPGQENVQSSESLNCRQVIDRIREFYMAPVIRFVYNTISYVAFLIIFSYMLLYELTHAIRPLEYVVIGWMVTLLLEEIKQATMSGISFSTYISDSWNKLDCIAVGLFTLGFILRMISLLSDVQSDEPGYDVILTSEFFIIARICYAFSLFAYYIRLMYIFSFHIALGPKLIMIGKMVINDLVPFMVILLVFVLGYGVAAQSIAYPTGLYTPEIDFNKTFPTRMSQIEVLVNFLTKSYFQMFGEFALDAVQAKDDGCKNDGQCPHWTAVWLVPVMLGVYVLLTNILMFNLLIAMFSSTYELINQFSALHWNYQRYSMIKEYIERSPLAPPLIFIWHAYQLGFYIQLRYNGLRRSDLFDPLKVKYIDNVKKERELIKWEHMKAMDYLRNGQETQQKSRGGRGDSKSIIVRTSGPQQAAGGGQSMFPGAAMDMAKQMTDATSGIGMELERKFKGVDTQLNKLGADLDGRVGELSTAVNGLSQLLTAVQETQRQILAKLDEQPTEPIPAVDPQLENRVRSVVLEMYQAPPAWFEEAARQAATAALQATPVSVRELGSPVLERLRPIQAPPPPPKPPTPPPPPPEEPPSPEESTSSDSDADDDQTTVRPAVDDPTTGRIIQYLTSDHRLWRYAPFNFEQYPGMRMNVPPDRIPWEIEYREYFAFDASDEVLLHPGPDSHDSPSLSVHSLPFNQYDSAHKLRRQSMMGRYRLDSSSGAPLNPMGRTGLKGKGLLPRWGPNNAAVVVMTRWNRAPSGAVIHRLGKPILQVVSLFRHKQFCLPWYLTDHLSHCDYDQCVSQFLRVFISRRLKQLMQHRGARQEITAVQKGRAEQIFKGYLDDHLNSDNAWIEAVVINIHESEGWKFSDAMLKVFAEADCDEQVKWMEVAYSTALRSSHCELLKTVASNNNAYF